MRKIDFSEFKIVTKHTKNMTGVAGEYFVCAELCRMNYLALLTPKNNPLFDVIATNPEGSKSVFISVKTMGVGNKAGWRLSKELTKRKNNPNLFVVLVDLKITGQNDYYIYGFDELCDKINAIHDKYMKKTKRDGTSRKDMDFRPFMYHQFKESDRKRKNNWEIIEYNLRQRIGI